MFNSSRYISTFYRVTNKGHHGEPRSWSHYIVRASGYEKSMRFSKVADRSPRRSQYRNNFTLLRKHRFEAKVLANQGRDILLRDAKDPKNAKRPANAANASPRPCDYDYITSHFYALLFPTSWSRDEEDLSTCWVFIDRSFFFPLFFFLQRRKKNGKNF